MNGAQAFILSKRKEPSFPPMVPSSSSDWEPAVDLWPKPWPIIACNCWHVSSVHALQELGLQLGKIQRPRRVFYLCSTRPLQPVQAGFPHRFQKNSSPNFFQSFTNQATQRSVLGKGHFQYPAPNSTAQVLTTADSSRINKQKKNTQSWELAPCKRVE